MSSVLRPTGIAEALQFLAADPRPQVLAGGTDFMVEVNYDRRRPTAVMSLRRVGELRGWHRHGDRLTVGAGLCYADMLEPEFEALAPALAQAARTVGSPQIRNTGTIGGNLATASPAGDTLPVLYALDAEVTVSSTRSDRVVPVQELVVGPKRTTLADDELIVSISIPVARGPQEFLKIGVRNAMVISVASVALVVDGPSRRIGCALGSVGPTVIRCSDAESMAEAEIDWDRLHLPDPRVYETFGSMCAGASSPIDDHRSTSRYRRHGIYVLARRALMRAFEPGG